MRHIVNDSDYQSASLINSGYPSRWQPWEPGASEPPSDSWEVERTGDGLTAAVDSAAGQPRWLRYYHRWPTEREWQGVTQGNPLPGVNPYSSRLITDFYPYNAYVNVDARRVYEILPAESGGGAGERMMNGGFTTGRFLESYQSGAGPEQFRGTSVVGNYNLSGEGMHWVGDLMLEADVETSDDSQELLLELVEAGVRYQCRIQLDSGLATLSINDGAPQSFDGEDNTEPTATTECRRGRRCQLRFSNCDDELLLWVNGSLVAFDTATTFDSRSYRNDDQNHPRSQQSHPLDAAPAGIAMDGGSATVRRLAVYRDKYYIATRRSGGSGLHDYDNSKLWRLDDGNGPTERDIQQAFTQPGVWETYGVWQTRRIVEFDLEADQFFPMGDNSPESLDARCWAGTKRRLHLPRDVNRDAYRWTNASYVPRDLLVGKAIVVFWPHSWNSPVPFAPNVSRMKLIQ